MGLCPLSTAKGRASALSSQGINCGVQGIIGCSQSGLEGILSSNLLGSETIPEDNAKSSIGQQTVREHTPYILLAESSKYSCDACLQAFPGQWHQPILNDYCKILGS